MILIKVNILFAKILEGTWSFDVADHGGLIVASQLTFLPIDHLVLAKKLFLSFLFFEILIGV